jgi:hypothetical protein
VIAAFLEFYHSFTAEASLPAFLLGLLEKLAGFFVPWAFRRRMPLAVAGPADLGFALTTPANLASVHSSNVPWFDPLTAFLSWTVDAVPS